MFTFTESELLSGRLPHARFTELVNQHGTHIHEIKLSTNLYGEFQFITLSAYIPKLIWQSDAKSSRQVVTFWGMGYHDSREIWECDQWRWHEAQLVGDESKLVRLAKPNVWLEINERVAFCVGEAKAAPPPTTHANAFAFFADMGDEDGATTMLEDMAALDIDVASMFDE